MNEKEIYELAMVMFSKDHQALILVEECAELQKELVKFIRGKVNWAHLAEEIMDVEIVLEQLKIIVEGVEPGLLADWKNTKLWRLEKRLEANDIEALK